MAPRSRIGRGDPCLGARAVARACAAVWIWSASDLAWGPARNAKAHAWDQTKKIRERGRMNGEGFRAAVIFLERCGSGAASPPPQQCRRGGSVNKRKGPRQNAAASRGGGGFFARRLAKHFLKSGRAASSKAGSDTTGVDGPNGPGRRRATGCRGRHLYRPRGFAGAWGAKGEAALTLQGARWEKLGARSRAINWPLKPRRFFDRSGIRGNTTRHCRKATGQGPSTRLSRAAGGEEVLAGVSAPTSSSSRAAWPVAGVSGVTVYQTVMGRHVCRPDLRRANRNKAAWEADRLFPARVFSRGCIRRTFRKYKDQREQRNSTADRWPLGIAGLILSTSAFNPHHSPKHTPPHCHQSAGDYRAARHDHETVWGRAKGGLRRAPARQNPPLLCSIRISAGMGRVTHRAGGTRFVPRLGSRHFREIQRTMVTKLKE